LQAKALETQAAALQSQAADTAKALEIAERNAEAVLLAAEQIKRLANTNELR
jgi:hypothetical protein